MSRESFTVAGLDALRAGRDHVFVRINGKTIAPDQAAVSVFDHGLLYGDGVFESLRFANGRPFELHAHLRRLNASARVLRLEVPYTPEELAEEIRMLIDETGARDGYIRLVVTRGVGDLGIHPGRAPRPTLILIAAPITVFADDLVSRGIRAITLPGRQPGVDGLGPQVKSLNYLPNVLGSLDAQAAGADEGIVLTPEGYVAEGIVDNVFLLMGGRLLQPARACGGLDGITAAAVWRLAEGAGIPVERGWLTRYDLYTADECFLTGTAVGLVPVVEIDGRPIGSGLPGPCARQLGALLEAAMQRGAVD